MSIYGYARVSTTGQDLKSQIEQLENAGVTQQNIYAEKFTGTKTDRPVFDQVLNKLQSGDTLTITKLDRFARNVSDANRLIKHLFDDGIAVNVLNVGKIENTATGRLIFNIFSSFAEFERDMIVSRTQEGKAYAKAHKTDYHEGRPKRTITPQYKAIYEYLKKHTYKDTAKAFKVSVATVYRIKKQVENNCF
uniref:recombinase family protein n=1 Tax=Lentilactobacillus hilgardii TaxID=1588 RepID=UPI00403F6A95